MRKYTAQFIVLAMLSLMAGAATHAQVIPPPISLSASPSSPAPRTQFTVTAATPTFDKDFAAFDWTVDGKARPEFSGVGKTEIALTAGAIGIITRISVSASRSNQDTANASLTIIPSDLALPWIAQTSIPKWFRGKALPTPGAVVSIIAVPRIVIGGVALNPETLIYRWRIDSDKDSLVGAGKRVFTFTASELPESTHQIDVSVQDIDGRIVKEGRVLITTDASPRVVLYPSSPLGGTEPGAAGSAGARPGLFDVIAEPFFFPLSSLSSLSYTWNVDGVDAAGSPQNPRVATVDATSRAHQTIPVSMTVHATNLFQNSFSGIFNLFISQ